MHKSIVVTLLLVAGVAHAHASDGSSNVLRQRVVKLQQEHDAHAPGSTARAAAEHELWMAQVGLKNQLAVERRHTSTPAIHVVPPLAWSPGAASATHLTQEARAASRLAEEAKQGAELARRYTSVQRLIDDAARAGSNSIELSYGVAGGLGMNDLLSRAGFVVRPDGNAYGNVRITWPAK